MHPSSCGFGITYLHKQLQHLRSDGSCGPPNHCSDTRQACFQNRYRPRRPAISHLNLVQTRLLLKLVWQFGNRAGDIPPEGGRKGRREGGEREGGEREREGEREEGREGACYLTQHK